MGPPGSATNECGVEMKRVESRLETLPVLIRYHIRMGEDTASFSSLITRRHDNHVYRATAGKTAQSSTTI